MELCKSILFVVEFGKHWMGGVYYVRNFLTTILHNEEIAKSHIYILCPIEHKAIFGDLTKHVNITIIDRHPSFRKINAVIRKSLAPFKRDFPIDIIWAARRIKATSIFPITAFPFVGGSKKCVFWIPDFQHFKLQNLFSKSELSYRTRLFAAISASGSRVVLSSKDASAHYHELFPNAISNPICIPFVSDIEREVEKLSPESEHSFLNSFGLVKNGEIVQYIYVPNQFWSHKNHLVAFEGFAEYCKKHPNSNIQIICTGSTQDYRAKDYFQQVKVLIDSLRIGDRVTILEFIDRVAQIAILKNCSILLQPSLFEGWGTGVQEAKRFAKKTLLSDIPIHLEQGDERSMLFSARSPKDLAEKLEIALNKSFPALSDSELKSRYSAFALDYSSPAGRMFLNNDQALEPKI